MMPSEAELERMMMNDSQDPETSKRRAAITGGDCGPRYSMTGSSFQARLRQVPDMPVIAADPKPRPTMAAVSGAVATHCGIPVVEIMGMGRSGLVSQARQIVMFLCHGHLGKSLPEIGRFMQRDHKTIWYGCGLVAKRVASDPAFGDTLNRIMAALMVSGENNAQRGEISLAWRDA